MKTTTTGACFFLGTTEESFNPLNVFANHSKSKNLLVVKVCMKRFEFACMTNLSPETVSIVLCQCSIMDSCKCRLFQISLRRLKFRPKRIQNALKNAHRGQFKLKKISGEIPHYANMFVQNSAI